MSTTDIIEDAKEQLINAGFNVKVINAAHKEFQYIGISRTSTHIAGIGEVISGDIRLLAFNEDNDQLWKLESHDGVLMEAKNLEVVIAFLEDHF